jgi:putative membrane protein
MAGLSQGDWSASGEQLARAWHETLALVGPPLFVAGLAILVVRALVQARRYRALAALSAADLDELHAAVREAERRTVGEIVPVVVERADDHPDARWLAALVVALAGSALLSEHLPWGAPALVLAAQVLLGALGYALASALPGFARAFVGERRASEVAEEQALQEFQRLELQRTEAATGVLLFVSLFERRVVVLGDRGIDEKIGAGWTEIDRAVLAGVERGALKAGLVEAIGRCGGVLAEHFPYRAGDRNELPDRVVVRAR